MNHLQMIHYHLGLVCSWCCQHFTTNSEAMCCHDTHCDPSTTVSVGGSGKEIKYDDDNDNDEDLITDDD